MKTLALRPTLQTKPPPQVAPTTQQSVCPVVPPARPSFLLTLLRALSAPVC
jgi:hypothetical protein